MLAFLQNNWSDLLLSAVGLSALLVYFFQRRDNVRSAATLILGQIDSIEKRVAALRDDHQLGNVSVYHSKTILRENMWEQYKHLFVKKLSSSEYEIVQQFFDNAEQIERARAEIIKTITTAWSDKSSVEHNVVGNIVQAHRTDTENIFPEMLTFQNSYRPLDLVFVPDIAIKSLTKNLSNFSMLSGTTAYKKIQKNSYSK